MIDSKIEIMNDLTILKKINQENLEYFINKLVIV